MRIYHAPGSCPVLLKKVQGVLNFSPGNTDSSYITENLFKGIPMKTLLALVMMFNCLSVSAATKDVLEAIAENANVGNGSADVTKAPAFTDAAGKKLLKYWAGRWDNCTFSKPYPTTKAALAALKEYSFDDATVNALKKLDQAGRIAKVYGFETDHDIACSQIWLNVYTVDGYVLELWYGLGD